MKVAVNRENLASIPKFGPEIKNRCTQEGLNGEKLTSILKSEPEIKNHFSSKSVLQAGHSSLRQRRPNTFPTSKNFYSTAFARGVTYIILPNFCFE